MTWRARCLTTLKFTCPAAKPCESFAAITRETTNTSKAFGSMVGRYNKSGSGTRILLTAALLNCRWEICQIRRWVRKFLPCRLLRSSLIPQHSQYQLRNNIKADSCNHSTRLPSDYRSVNLTLQNQHNDTGNHLPSAALTQHAWRARFASRLVRRQRRCLPRNAWQ